jgi:hypothetical protein
MKKIWIISLFLSASLAGNSQTKIFNELLQVHIDKSGTVAYEAFDLKKLTQYLKYLERTTPKKTWSKDRQKAFWINAYNAYTLHIVLKNYPVKSILDIKKGDKTAWEIPFAKVGGKMYTLNYIEHTLLLKNLFDPRIHVAINCASTSCPKLSNIAFTEANIDINLQRRVFRFHQFLTGLKKTLPKKGRLSTL